MTNAGELQCCYPFSAMQGVVVAEAREGVVRGGKAPDDASLVGDDDEKPEALLGKRELLLARDLVHPPKLGLVIRCSFVISRGCVRPRPSPLQLEEMRQPVDDRVTSFLAG